MKRFTLIAVLGAMAVANGTAVHACSCASSLQPAAETTARFNSAEAVFVGTAIEVITERIQVKRPDNSEDVAIHYRVRFSVKQVFKGAVGGSATTDNGLSTDSCSFGEMTVGRDYLVYAAPLPFGASPLFPACCDGQLPPPPRYPPPEVTPPLHVGLCGGTRLISDESYSKHSRELHAKEIELLRNLSFRMPLIAEFEWQQQ